MRRTESPIFLRVATATALLAVLTIALAWADHGSAADSLAPRSSATDGSATSLLPRNPAVRNAADWNLIFHDEFNGDFLDTKKWSRLRGNKHKYGSPFNRSIESAAYSIRNVTQNKGAAVLTLKRRPAKDYPRYPYSSGLIQSGPSFAFKYGYLETRVKVPRCSGCWPAFWLLESPPDSNWPPEIDVFEYFDTARDKRPYFNFHYAVDGKRRQLGIKPYGDAGSDYVNGWHTFGMLWTPETIQVFMDGQPGPTYNDPTHIPSRAKYLIFNLALQRGKRPRSGSKMQIDWVRVWQPKG